MAPSNINQMTNAELLDLFDENPKGFLSKFAQQIRHELMSELTQKEQAEARRKQQEEIDNKLSATFQNFADEHPEFIKMYDAGELEKFMKEHPGHNALSAYFEISRQQEIERGVSEALSKKKDESAPLDTALTDTKEAGGLANVLWGRIQSQREAGGKPVETEDTGELVETVSG